MCGNKTQLKSFDRKPLKAESSDPSVQRQAEGQWVSLLPARSINNDLVKYIPQGAIGDQEEMAQLDGEQVLCCGPEAPASLSGEQWSERGDAAVHPQQEQLADPHVQPAGREPGHLSAAAAGDATPAAGPDAATSTPPTLVPMTSLTNPFLNPYPNPYPDDTTMEMDQVWPASTPKHD